MSSSSQITLGKRLKQLRQAKGLMQREVGSAIGLDCTYISKVESNKKAINRNHLNILAQILDAEEDELQTLWLSDRIFQEVQYDPIAIKSLKLTIKRLAQ